MELLLQIIKILSGPFIGAAIGYFTNYIAVKMLFRPYDPKKIGKLTLPFTPGIIPKRKPVLAKAIGIAVGETLLTGEDVFALFSSKETEDLFVSSLLSELDTLPDGVTPESLLREVTDRETIERGKEALSDFLTERIASAAEERNLGKIVREKGALLYEKKKASLGMLAMFLSPAMIENALVLIEEEVNRTVSEEGRSMLYPVLTREVEQFFSAPVRDSLRKMDRGQAEAFLRALYRKLVETLAPKLLSELDVASVVEEKVNAMNVKELETLCFSVMKRELNAIVNLGALIGFLLGVVNVFL